MKTTLLGCFRKLVFPAALGLVAIAIGAGPAAATYPGANGRIVFATGTNDLWSVLDDGSGLELLTTVVAPPGVSSFASYPSFSADGSKIAVMERARPSDSVRSRRDQWGVGTVQSPGPHERRRFESAGRLSERGHREPSTFPFTGRT